MTTRKSRALLVFVSSGPQQDARKAHARLGPQLSAGVRRTTHNVHTSHQRPSRRLSLTLFIGTLTLLLACSQSQERPVPTSSGKSTAELLFSLEGSDSDYEAGIRALLDAKIHRDVAIAAQRNDRRLIGVQGYALSVPGFEGALPSGFTVVTIKGTSDVVNSDAQSRFQKMLYSYAKTYNTELVRASR